MVCILTKWKTKLFFFQKGRIYSRKTTPTPLPNVAPLQTPDVWTWRIKNVEKVTVQCRLRLHLKFSPITWPTYNLHCAISHGSGIQFLREVGVAQTLCVHVCLRWSPCLQFSGPMRRLPRARAGGGLGVSFILQPEKLHSDLCSNQTLLETTGVINSARLSLASLAPLGKKGSDASACRSYTTTHFTE